MYFLFVFQSLAMEEVESDEDEDLLTDFRDGSGYSSSKQSSIQDDTHRSSKPDLVPDRGVVKMDLNIKKNQNLKLSTVMYV